MKAEMRMALGLGAGYLLGRSRKLRLTGLIAAAAASGKLGDAGQLVRRKAGSVGGSSVIGEIAGDLPGRLVEAGKAAAVTAATARVDSLVDKLHTQTEALRRPGVPSVGSEDEAGPGKGRRPSTADRSPDDEYDEEQDEGPDDGEFDDDDSDEEAEDDDTSGAPPRSERDRNRRPRTPRSAESRARDIDDDSERRPRKRSSSDRGDAPIRRTRR